MVDEVLDPSADNFVEGITQLFGYWGLSKAMGSIFALLYLRKDPTSLEDIATELRMSKGNVSLNIREVERLGMVRKVWNKGDRRDFYEVEENLWKIVRTVSRERQRREFDLAVKTVERSLEMLPASGASPEARFARKRLKDLDSFLKNINRVVNTILGMDSIRGVMLACPVLSRIGKKKRAAQGEIEAT